MLEVKLKFSIIFSATGVFEEQTQEVQQQICSTEDSVVNLQLENKRQKAEVRFHNVFTFTTNKINY